jgi:hypothetical protein
MKISFCIIETVERQRYDMGDSMKKISVFTLLILPAAMVFVAALLHYAQGPHWISYNSDPEYLYLFNSLALAESKQTGTTGNPGTTLQMLGAATMKISHAVNFSEKDSLESSVLENPEFYLNVINIVLVTLNVLLLFIIGLVTFNLTRNIWLSLLLQFSPFLSKITLTWGLSRVSPEPLLLFSGLLFVLILMKMVFSKNLAESAHWYMTALALVSGFGIATKLTFAPLLIIPLFVLPKLRNKIGFLFLTGISFILWTWPIISQYEILFNWYYRILTHTGLYGLGNSGIIDIGIYSVNLQNLILQNPLFFLIWLFTAGFIMRFSWSAESRKKSWSDTSFRILSASAVAQLCAVLIVAKHSAEQYLLPVLSLSGFILFLILLYLQRFEYFSRFKSRKGVFVACVFFFFISLWMIIDIKDVFVQKTRIKEETLKIYQTLESKYKNYIKIFVLRASSPIGALAFGNFFVNDGLYSASLQKIYGEAHFINVFNGKFHTWTREFSIEDIILKGDGNKIIISAPPLSDTDGKIISQTGSVLHLRDVFDGKYETIYALDGITLTWGGSIRPPAVTPFPR